MSLKHITANNKDTKRLDPASLKPVKEQPKTAAYLEAGYHFLGEIPDRNFKVLVDGVSAGEQVVVNGLARISPNSAVDPVPAEPEASAVATRCVWASSSRSARRSRSATSYKSTCAWTAPASWAAWTTHCSG